MFDLLFISPDTQVSRILADSLKHKGITFSYASTGTQGIKDILRKPSLVFLDSSLQDLDSFELALKIKQISPDSKVVNIIYPEEHGRLKSIYTSGNKEYLEKPFSLLAFHLLVDKLLKDLKEVRESHLYKPKDEFNNFNYLAGNSPAAENLRHLVVTLSNTDETVCLIGEKGTGKESVAKAIHERSRYRNGHFITLNLSVVPQSLHIFEIFGRENDRYSHGCLSQAINGTILLKEIARLHKDGQERMLKKIQENNIECRIMVSSESDLSEAIENGDFLPELFTALSKNSVFIPPLSQRQQDILVIAEGIIKDIAKQIKKRPKTLSTPLQHYLVSQEWKGNIRELEDNLRMAFLSSKGHELTFENIVPKKNYSLQEFIEERLSSYMNNIKRFENLNLYNTVLLEVERILMMIALKETRGNQIQAARLLNINRNTIHKKISDLHINIKDFKTN